MCITICDFLKKIFYIDFKSIEEDEIKSELAWEIIGESHT